MPLKRWIRAALGAVCLALPSGVHAAGLFLPATPAGVAEHQNAAVAVAEQEQRVRIARQDLRAARHDVENSGAGRLLLNVADAAHFDVVVERTTPTKWGYTLSGRVAGGAGGFVTLVVHEDAVAGSIWTPDSAYELSYKGGGVHALRDVTDAPPATCSGALPPESLPRTRSDQGGVDDGSVVDILVVWTPEAEDEYGGSEAQLLSRVDMLIAYTNDAFERSGAFVSLNLVGAERVDYVESDLSTDYARLSNPTDGYIDEVHDRRDALGADLTYLLTARWWTGAAGGMWGVSGATNWVFAHEVGHNFGILHDRGDSLAATRAYEHGFTTDRCTTSFMSRSTHCAFALPAPFYGSPWRFNPRDGLPLGVPRLAKERGARGPADAVLTLNRNRHRVANHRPSRNGNEQ